MMNTQENKSERQETSYKGYSSYEDAPGEPASEIDPKRKRTIERDIILQEYQNDREAILFEIKSALRERHYKEAQEFIYRYRAAAKTDESFAVLARMTAEGLESDRQIETLVTQLEATPEDDKRAKADLCKKILAIQPHNQKYIDELQRCQEPVQGSSNEAIAKPKESAFSPACAVAFSLVLIVNLGLSLTWIRAIPGMCIMLAATLLQYWLLSNHRFSPLRKAPDFLKILINFWIWWLYVFIIMHGEFPISFWIF